MTAVSIVIPTYNRPTEVRGCLRALAASARPAGGMEVVVVDDGGREPLDAVVAPFREQLDVQLLRQANAGPAAARNTGALAAHGKILLFTDDDCRPHRLWVRRMAKTLQAAGTEALAGGVTRNLLRTRICSEASQLIVGLVYDFYNARLSDARFFASNNMGCWRETYLRWGGFNSDFQRCASEDRELCDRWRALGGKLVHEPRAVIGHRHALGLADYWRQHFFYGRGANLYHKLRHARQSGKMTEDMGFHARLPRLAWRRLRRYPPGRAAALLALLGVWQVANAAGFFYDRFSAGPSPRVRPFPEPLAP